MNIPIVSPIGQWVKESLYGKPIREVDLPQPPPPPDFSKMDIPQFTEAHYKSSELMMVVDSKESFLTAVQNSLLSYRCKMAIINFVQTYYDRTVILSDLTGQHEPEIAYIRSVIDRMVSIISNSRKYDRANPQFITFMQLAQSMVWFRITRTKDKESRERVLNAVLELRYSTRQKVTPETIKQMG